MVAAALLCRAVIFAVGAPKWNDTGCDAGCGTGAKPKRTAGTAFATGGVGFSVA